MDRLAQIPPTTLAGKLAKQQAEAANRDLVASGGTVQVSAKVQLTLDAAKQFAQKATELSQNPPHPSTKWQEIENLWDTAIRRLGTITPEEGNGYAEAQSLMASYQASLAETRVQLQNEETASLALAQAKRKIADLWASVPSKPTEADRNQMAGELLKIRNDLDQVAKGTTAYTEAQNLLRAVQQRLKELGKS